MRNFRITFLLVGCLFVFGIYGLVHIPKQEFPEYTIRQGVVVGVYPGATSEEVEEQLAKPLEQFLMTYKEVKRSKTTSTSQNGMCYVMVELNDDLNDKDEVWSKIKHGLAAFKMQLPAGVAALVTNDDFGDTSALLITLESDTRSYRELKGYMDDLSDRLRRIESVSNLRPYGVQQEQISVYADHDRLAAYGIGEKVLSAALASQGLTPAGGSVSNGETETPIHIAPSLAGEREVAEQIVWSDPEGHVLRVKDVARVVREYDDPDSYIRNNGHRCVLLSMEMRGGYNIVEYGREVDEALHAQKPDALLLTAAGIDGDDAALPVVRLAQIFIAQPFTRTVEPQQRRAHIQNLQRPGHGSAPRLRTDHVLRQRAYPVRIKVLRRRKAADRAAVEPDAHAQPVRRAQHAVLHIAKRADDRPPRILRFEQAHIRVAARAQKICRCLRRLLRGEHRLAAVTRGVVAQHFPALHRERDIRRVVPVIDIEIPARDSTFRAAGRAQARCVHVQKHRSRSLCLPLRDVITARQHGVLRRRALTIRAVSDRQRQILK